VVEEEDPRQRLAYDRTLLANERTFAAWIRTGLSVAAVGLAAGQLLPRRRPAPVRRGAGGAAGGRRDRDHGLRGLALRRRRPRPAGAGSPAARAPTAIYALTALVALLLAGCSGALSHRRSKERQ
jgi:hypothetical protein